MSLGFVLEDVYVFTPMNEMKRYVFSVVTLCNTRIKIRGSPLVEILTSSDALLPNFTRLVGAKPCW